MNRESAFPGVELNGNGQLYDSWPGMTLRDYFAAKVVNSIAGGSSLAIAKQAYELADAMLLARDLAPKESTNETTL